MKKVVVIPGDGIGKEVMDAAMLILEKLNLPFDFSYYEAGDEALEKYGKALPDESLRRAGRVMLCFLVLPEKLQPT